MSDVLLDVQDLKTFFYTRDGIVKAVNGVSFSVRKGEVLGIVGESGSGKSVANMSLLGLVPHPPGRLEGGQALFEGMDLLHLDEDELRKIRGRKISMIFQDPMTSLNPFLKVSTQLTEVLREHFGVTKGEALHQAIEMLRKVGIPHPAKRIHDYPHQFSGGMRQRVMIAMALLCKPQLLIADEPTTALDVTIQAQILELLKKMQSELGMAIVLITHNLGVVAGMCDDVVVMYAGKMVEYAPAADLFASPMHPYTRGLLKSVPRLDEDRQETLTPVRDQPPDLANLPTGCAFHPRCDMAIEKCRTDEPPLMPCGNGHRAACWVTCGRATSEQGGV